jgi:hypothetical protein
MWMTDHRSLHEAARAANPAKNQAGTSEAPLDEAGVRDRWSATSGPFR